MTIADPRVTAGMAVPTLPGQTLNAAWVNNVSVAVQRAVDSVGGGVIQPSPEIEIQGDGLKVSGPFSASAATSITTNSLTMTGTNRVSVASRSITRAVEHPWTYSDADWQLDSNGFPTSQAIGVVAWLPLHFPDNCTITAVTVYIDPPGGHAAFPGGAPTFPTITLYDYGTSGIPVTYGPATDAPASVAAYESIHALTLSGLSINSGRAGNRYKLKFTDESGGNGIAGMKLKLELATYTCTEYDED